MGDGVLLSKPFKHHRRVLVWEVNGNSVGKTDEGSLSSPKRRIKICFTANVNASQPAPR